jgi:hypothetical protein
MESSAMNKIMALAFLFLGLTILFWILGMVLNITSLMILFVSCGIIAVVLIIISAAFMWSESRESV